MPRRTKSSPIIDGILRVTILGGVISTQLVAPNSLKAFDKPLRAYFKKLDERRRQREFEKAVRYMRYKGLVEGTYEHGITITKKGRERIEKADLDNLSINKPKKWDKKWRIVMFDIPEDRKTGRDALTFKLRFLGFYQLQKSVWLYPYECRDEIETLTGLYRVNKFVTYIETSFIDKQELLKKKFRL